MSFHPAADRSRTQVCSRMPTRAVWFYSHIIYEYLIRVLKFNPIPHFSQHWHSSKWILYLIETIFFVLLDFLCLIRIVLICLFLFVCASPLPLSLFNLNSILTCCLFYVCLFFIYLILFYQLFFYFSKLFFYQKYFLYVFQLKALQPQPSHLVFLYLWFSFYIFAIFLYISGFPLILFI